MTAPTSFSADLLAVTEKMLVAAQLSDWDVLLALEDQRAQTIEAVKAESEAGVAYMNEASIRAVQVLDQEIGRLVANRLVEINDIFNVSPLGRRLSRAYSDMAN